jgi:hypothetical protein
MKYKYTVFILIRVVLEFKATNSDTEYIVYTTSTILFALNRSVRCRAKSSHEISSKMGLL